MALLTIAELLATLTRWGEKGTLKKATAENLRSACERVFSVLDQTEREDVGKIDLNSALQRFHNLNPSVSSESLRVYKSRVEKAVLLFSTFKKDPINWKPNLQTRTRRQKKTESQGNGSQEGVLKSDQKEVETRTPNDYQAPPSFVSTLTIPFPLRPDVTINIAGVPRDLTNAECERIAAFLRPLAVDFGKN